jgi:hypothetical protein
VSVDGVSDKLPIKVMAQVKQEQRQIKFEKEIKICFFIL